MFTWLFNVILEAGKRRKLLKVSTIYFYYYLLALEYNFQLREGNLLLPFWYADI